MAKITKFNIHWQITRVLARGIKDPSAKLSFVLDYLDSNPSIHNLARVLNWVKMTGVGYSKQPLIASIYDSEAKDLEANRELYKGTKDNDNDLSKISTDQLQLVYDDLKARKYGFQFKSVPVEHTQFVAALAAELGNRS